MDARALPDAVPDAVREAWDHFHGLHVPEDLPKETAAIYKRGTRGKCMMCNGKVGEETIIVITLQGINQIYCSHRCNQDMNVMGWIGQQYDDLKQAVEFRGQRVH